MNKIIITTDSGSDLTIEVAQQYNIHVIPMHVLFGSEDRLDDGTLSTKEVVEFFDQSGKLPTSAATNPYEYENFFKKIQAENPGCSIVHVAYSSQTTSSFRNAEIGIEDLQDIYLVDSYNVSVGLGFIAIETAKFVRDNDNITVQDVIEKVNYLAKKTRFSALIYTLEYLKAGGRVSNSTFLVGQFLRIRPEIELIGGLLKGTHRYRGSMLKAAGKMFRAYLERYDVIKDKMIFVRSHGLEDGVMEEIESIAKEHGIKEYMWLYTGAVITVHSGPGALGIVGLEK